MTSRLLVVIICAALHFVCVIGLQSDAVQLPSYLERPVIESITSINLLLDNAQDATHARKTLTLDTIEEMHRAIGHDGPIDVTKNVGRYVYARFLDDADAILTKLSADVTHCFGSAVCEVAAGLKRLLPACEVDAVIDDIKCQLNAIDVQRVKKTTKNEERFWDLYEEVSDKLVRLHATRCLCGEVYNTRLEEILLFGRIRLNRIINSSGSSVERYLAKIADDIRSILKQALLPLCKQKKS